jgi:nondiscriminating glutamyl-tRNA synthetase
MPSDPTPPADAKHCSEAALSASGEPGVGPVRVRFAPSPTGYLHVGGARTALYNYLLAKKLGGEFVLRVEDTDLERSTDESMRMQIQDLLWLGIEWDEGPDPKTYADMGPNGPYRQSRRGRAYEERAQKLVAEGRAYYDFRDDAELEALKQKAIAAGRPHQVEAPAEIVAPEAARARIAAGEKAAIRFRVREKRDYALRDLIRGEINFPSDMVGDFVLMRSNGMPVYNFCCAVDDALMGITHVFRAEEHLSNTLRQMMLYEAMGLPAPRFGHLSVVLGTDRQKLSKRHGATSCHEYAERGYLPEALCNFIALLGWSSPKGQEILSREELIEQFTYERFHAAPAVFDEQKLLWVNATHLRALPHSELWRRIEPFLAREGIEAPTDPSWRDRALGVFKTSMSTLADAPTYFRYFSDASFRLAGEAKEILGWPETRRTWAAWREILAATASAYMTAEDFAKAQEEVKVRAGVKGKHLFMPIRVAIIGQPHGAELKELVPLMPVASLRLRVAKAEAALS